MLTFADGRGVGVNEMLTFADAMFTRRKGGVQVSKPNKPKKQSP